MPGGPRPIPLLAHNDHAPAYWHVDILWAMLATGDQTGGQYSLIEEWCPKDSGPPPHIHETQDEAFYILEGSIEFQIGDRQLVASAGSLVSIPRGTAHSFRITTETAHVLNFYSPAGFEEMVMALGTPAPSRTIPPKAISDPDPRISREWAQKVHLRPAGDPGDRKDWLK